MNDPWFHLTLNMDDDEHSLFMSEDDLFGVDFFDLKIGMAVQEWNPNAWLRSTERSDDGEPQDFLQNHLDLPIVSTRLRKALEVAKVASNDVQFLDIKVFRSTGQEVKGYAVANILSRPVALDFEKSTMLELDEDEVDPVTGKGRVVSVWDAALRGRPIAGKDMIRLAEFFPPVFVSSRFAAAYRRGRFTGASLSPVKVS